MGNLIIRQLLALCMAGKIGLAMGQNLAYTNEAVRHCENENWTEALSSIQKAMNSEETRNAHTWYVDGYIHKELYKRKETGQVHSTMRTRSVESFMKTIEMDTVGKDIKMAKLGLKYLASTYYNDALMLTQTFNLSEENEAKNYFDKFCTLMQIAEPRTGLSRFTKEFDRNMGQRYYQLWLENLNLTSLPEKIINCYNQVLQIDTTDSDAWYNISVVYYNQAVFKYRLLDSKTDMFDLITIQQECSELISKKALPAMSKAYQLQPEKGEIVRGMMYVNRALEREKDTEYFKQEVSRLIREGKIGSINKQP